jgi:AcrR family transcriptional regulator
MLTVGTLTTVPPRVDTVNMQRPRPYHHGSLRAALVEAGYELARAEGPEAVVLRAVTRAAGVSHNAAYRHFADHRELLNAVADRCMGDLGDLMRERTRQVRVRDTKRRAIAELRAIGRAYIDFAVAEPGLFRTAFAIKPGPDAEGGPTAATRPPPAQEEELGPYELLGARLDRLVEVGALPAARRPGAENAAWSAVHGLSMLLVDGPLRDLPDTERDWAIDVTLTMVERGL